MGGPENRYSHVLAALAAAVLLAYALVTLVDVGAGVESFFTDYVYNALLCGAAAGCVLRGVLVRSERAAWLTIGAGMVAWAAADLYYTAVLADDPDPPYPSIADGLYLAFYPAAYVGLWLLVRERIVAFNRGLILDGLVGALAIGALATALTFQTILDASGGSDAAVATNLAYPVGDLILLGLLVGVVALTGWRPGRTWLLLVAGLATSAVADGIYLYQVAEGTYVAGTILDVFWPASMLLIAYAAWQPATIVTTVRADGWRILVLPALFGIVGIALLVYDHFHRLNDLALVLAGLTLVGVVTRMTMLFRENVRMLAQSRVEALTDALTGLHNRRSLVNDLEQAIVPGTARPFVLILFDLDGFKQYNDVFGHPAGDALLVRLAAKLDTAVSARARAYRMGGDEFCVLLPDDGPAGAQMAEGAADALSEHGEGFVVTASWGMVALPSEADTAAVALQLADQRMYDHKGQRRPSPRRQTRDVLLQALRERAPDLGTHVHDVADLARAVGERFGLVPLELDELVRAAELHDIGKMAIPDAILDKPGPLDEAEWAFMKRHTIFGERILAAAPALVPVARLVRASHEHHDGSGYPDALEGDSIPLGSRIILVCDAYHAMVTDRPYAQARGHSAALEELRRCAGGQFDPQVVETFCAVANSRRPGEGVVELGPGETAPRGR